MAKKGLVSKMNTVVDSSKQLKTSTIIDEIFSLTDGVYKNQYKIQTYMHELKTRGEDAIYEYYVKYVKRVLEEEIDIKQINVHHALNEVIKLNDAEKLWNFINILQDIQSDSYFKIDMKKCSNAIAATNNLKYNLYWAEIYTQENQANIKTILNSEDISAITRMIELVDNLTEQQIADCIKVIKNAKTKKDKKEVKKVAKDKNLEL